MANLSQEKRNRMLTFLNTIKEEHSNDSDMLKAIYEIEKELMLKKYGLVWEEHEENVDIKMRTHIPVFTEDKTREIISENPSNKFNFLLEGDNLHSLKLLEKTHKGKVDVIYIDPPYNTGNKDFKYDDNIVDKEDGFRHSKWLSFMFERLQLAKKLLADDGVIMISIDENEQAQLKILCDEVFNEANYLATFHIQVRYVEKSLTEEKPFKPVLEYVLIYAKNIMKFIPNRPEEEYTDEKFNFEITELTPGEDFYVDNQKVTVFKKGEWEIKKHDESSRNLLKETWISGTIYTKMSYGKVFQAVVEPRVEIDGLSCLYKVHGRGDDGLGFRYYTGPQRANAKRGKMYSGMPLKRVEEIEQEGISVRYLPITTYYDYAADFGNINHEGGVTFNSGKKPLKLIKQLINLSQKKDAIVLDFFAGSGTTGQATIELNKDDGGNRRYILCTNNEKNICEEVTYKRFENIQENLSHNLKYYKTDFVSRIQDDGDLVSEQLLNHIKEMVQLEYGICIDNNEYLLILTDEKADEIESEWQKHKNCKSIYISRNVLLTSEQQKLFKCKNIYAIPDYYFENELRGIGEVW